MLACGLTSLLVLSGCCGGVSRPVRAAGPSAGAVYFSSGNGAALYAVDWDGRTRAVPMASAPPGTPGPGVKPAATRPWVSRVSPDGSRLLMSDGSIRDRAGKVVGALDPAAGLMPSWADDNRHLCQLTTPGYSSFTGGTLVGPAVLTWVAPGNQPHVVATVGHFGPNATAKILACTQQNGLAVIANFTVSAQSAKTGLNPVTTLLVVRLADGSILDQRAYPVSTNPIGGYVVSVSPDGRYAAEAEMVVHHGPVGPAVVRELPTGNVVATLEPLTVLGFSGDHSRIFASTSNEVKVIKWRTGEVVWKHPGEARLAAYQPGGSAFMVRERTLWKGLLTDGLWLVFADGSDRLVAKDVGEVYAATDTMP